MLYLFFGEHAEEKKNARDKVFAEGSFSGIFSFSADDWQPGKITELAASNALFGGSLFVTLENVLGNKDTRSAVLERLTELAASPNTFVFLEPKALKEITDAFKVAKATIQEFKATPAAWPAKDAFNSFALTDAVGARNKKESWVLLTRAFMAGKSPEEISGLVFWQLKSMLLVKGGGTAVSLGMKPFVYSKAASFAQKWTKEELVSATSMLVSQTHASRRGEIESEAALEKLILEYI